MLTVPELDATYRRAESAAGRLRSDGVAGVKGEGRTSVGASTYSEPPRFNHKAGDPAVGGLAGVKRLTLDHEVPSAHSMVLGSVGGLAGAMWTMYCDLLTRSLLSLSSSLSVVDDAVFFWLDVRRINQ